MEDKNISEAQLVAERQILRRKISELEREQAIRRLECKRSANELLLSQEKFSKAFHCNPDPVSISTLKEGRFVEVNQAFEQLTGYKRHEVIGKTPAQLGILVVPEDLQLMYKQIREQGKIISLETKFRDKDDDIRTYLLSAEIIDLDSEPLLLNVSKDITERKRVEEALRLSEECFSKAFNASPIAMTLNTFRDGQVIDVNDSFCRILGASRERICGQTTQQLAFWVDPMDLEQVKQFISIKGSVSNMEFRFRRLNGEIWLGLYSAEKVDIDDEICLLSLFTDLTARRQMEIEMSRLDQLNLVGEMAVSISHEIRNPMTTVRGYMQILREKKEYMQEVESIDLMIEELDRANKIITEFLSLAKNKMVELKPLSLNSILTNIFPLLESNALINGKGISLKTEILPDLLLDENEIRQLIYNLINNALESNPAGKNVEIRTYMENNDVVLAVRDQGKGIEQETLQKLGTPFFTTKEHGTGLGLAVCYGIATRHNAKIDVDSNSSGTTFLVRFKQQL